MSGDARATSLEERRGNLTRLLGEARHDPAAAERVLAEVYPELKRIAGRSFRRERRGHTLQPTALVNEAYLRVFGPEPVDWRDRAHFLAVLARQIRWVLVDHGRSKRAEKRGAGVTNFSLDDHDVAAPEHMDYVDLDESLTVLGQEDSRAARVVELRFFGGLTESETAEVLGTSVPTVSRDWKYARAWLAARLRPR